MGSGNSSANEVEDISPGDESAGFRLKSVHVVIAIVVLWVYGIVQQHSAAYLMPWLIVDWTSWWLNTLSSMATGGLLIAAAVCLIIFLIVSLVLVVLRRPIRYGHREFLIATLAAQLCLVLFVPSDEEVSQTRKQLERLENDMAQQRQSVAAARSAIDLHGLPAMVDDQTRLDRTYFEGLSLNFRYTLTNVSSVEIDTEAFRESRDSYLPTMACANQELRQFMDAGGFLVYVYSGNDDQVVATIPIYAWDCGS